MITATKSAFILVLVGCSLFLSQAEAANLHVGDDSSMIVSIADKPPEEKALILDRRAWYFLKGDHTSRRLRLLDSSQEQLILRLHSTLQPGAYELFVQSPGHKKLAINHNVQVHSPQILAARADTLNPGGRVSLTGNYFGQHPRLFLDYEAPANGKLQSLRIQADAKSFQYDDRWDKYATLYPTDTLTGESHLEVVLPPLPKNAQLVGIRLVSHTGEATQLKSGYEDSSERSKKSPQTTRLSVPPPRGELIGWAVRDTVIARTQAWDFMLNGLTDQGGWWTKAAANGLLITSKLWRDMKYDLRMFTVSYYTEDLEGRRVPASGVLILPVTAEGARLPLLSLQHGTLLEKRQAPSLSNGPELGIAVAMASASGLMMSLPDYFGLGMESLNHPEQQHRYCQWAPLAGDSGDMLLAVTRLLQNESFRREVNAVPTHDGRLFLTGYSEGGYASLGLHRAMEEHPEQFGGLQVTASAPLSGGYASSTVMLDRLLERKTLPFPSFAAYLWISLNRTTGIFPAPAFYLSRPYDETLPPLFDGQHPEALISKKMPPIPSDILLPQVRTALENRTGQFFSAIKANDLAGDDDSGYRLRAPVHFIHGAEDELVPRENTDRVLRYLKEEKQKANVDGIFLSVNPVMWVTHSFGVPYHALYAPFAFGEFLAWLDLKIIETQPLSR